MKTTTKWVAFGAGIGCVSLLGRAMIGNAAGVCAAVLSDFEARRNEVALSKDGVHRSVRTPSTKLPPRLKADIALARSASANKTIDLTETPVAR